MSPCLAVLGHRWATKRGEIMKHSLQVLTFIETSINAAKPKDGKRTEFRIKTTRGNIMEHLVLEVLPARGRASRPKRVWRVHYDSLQDGKRLRRKIKIGDTATALTDIDLRWREIENAISSGRDWCVEQEREELKEKLSRRKAYTFADLANDYLERHAKLKKRTWRDDLSKLNRYVLPRLGAREAKDIAKREIIEIIDHIAIERNAPVQADRTKALLSSIFNWGQDEDLVQSNPADRIRTRSTRKRRTRLFSYEELKALWVWCEQPAEPGRTQARTVIKLAILLGQRRNQIAAARKSELIGLGTPRAAWHIPHARNKNKDDLHVVPLPALAEKLFVEAVAAAGGSPFVFPSSTKHGVSLHADTVTDELTCARKALSIEPSDTGEEVVLHAIRHLFKTEMRKLSVPAEVRRRIQSHRSPSSTSDMDEWYDHSDNYDADRDALELWERRLHEILG
jgi:site-specific recombinase XerD